MIVVAFIILAIIVAILLRVHFAPNYKIMQQFGGPPPDPILGNLRQLQFNDLDELYTTMRGWENKYKTMWMLKYGTLYTVFIEKAEQLEAVLKNSVNIQKSRDYQFIEPWLGRGLLISDGQKWHRRRKQLTPAFHFQILKDFVPIFNEQSQIFLEVLKDKSASGDAVDISPLLCALTLDIICETAMGKQLNSQQTKSPYADALYEYSNIAVLRSFKPHLWPDFIFNLLPVGKRSNKSLKVLHDFTNSVIRERISYHERSENAETEEADTDTSGFGKRKRRMAFLDLLIKLQDEDGIDFEGIREEVDTFMFEGHDTTATGLMWALYLIAAHPDVQTRLQEEIDEVFDSLADKDVLTSEDVSGMQYLECVLKETQRYFPSVPVIGRTITNAFDVDGYHIPAGTTMNVSIIGVHRNPDHWPDPEVFDPARFEPDNVVGRHPFSFVPFSAGPRNCIGQKFALLEEKIVICHALRNFDIEAVNTVEELLPSIQMVLKARDGVWINFKQRRGNV